MIAAASADLAPLRAYLAAARAADFRIAPELEAFLQQGGLDVPGGGGGMFILGWKAADGGMPGYWGQGGHGVQRKPRHTNHSAPLVIVTCRGSLQSCQGRARRPGTIPLLAFYPQRYFSATSMF